MGIQHYTISIKFNRGLRINKWFPRDYAYICWHNTDIFTVIRQGHMWIINMLIEH